MNAAEDLKKLTNTRLKGNYIQLASELAPAKRVQSGLMALDEHTAGGLPMGVPISIQGRKSVGKSAFCYYMAGKAVEQHGGIGVLMQTEGGFVPAWAEMCGLPPCDFVPVFQGDKLQETLELVLDILRNSTPTYVILDSLSMLARDPDKSLLDSESHGGRAKPINAFFRNLIAAMDDEHPPLFLYIEHLHPTIGVPGLTTTGGETKGYANVMEIRLTLDEFEKKGVETGTGKQELPVKQKVRWEIRKSKVSPTRGAGSYTLGLRETDWSKAGEISDFDELLARAIKQGHVTKAGAWYQIGDEKYQGSENLKAAVGTSTIRELALRERAVGGEEDSRIKRVKKTPPKRSRPIKGRPGGGAVSDGTQDGNGKTVDPETGVVTENNQGSDE